MALPEPELAAQQPAAEFSLFVDGGRRRGARGAAGGRASAADDYAAHFHHYPWRGAGLTLRPRLLRRLGVEVTSTHDDESDEDAELELAAAGEHWGRGREADRMLHGAIGRARGYNRSAEDGRQRSVSPRRAAPAHLRGRGPQQTRDGRALGGR